MNYTNCFKLPPEIVAALTKDRYNPDGEQDLGDYSATKLIAPVQQTILKARHPDKMRVFDVIDNFWAFVGSIAHKVLEEHGSDDAMQEQRLNITIMDKVLSGCVDHYKGGVITDYKSTKCYKIMKGDYSEWEKQLNIYAYIYGKHGYPVTKLRIFTFILDWKKGEAYKQGYPKCPIMEIPLRLWSTEEQRGYIEGRLIELAAAHNLPNEELPECSDKEMWRDIKDYAILKEGGKRAVKLYDTEKEARLHPLKEGESLVTRHTRRTRCFDFCPCSNICEQHKRLCQEEGIEHTDTNDLIF